jgi:hypothetical protein
MRDGAHDHVVGLGTGNHRALQEAVAECGSTIYMSGMSSKTGGLSAEELEGKLFQFTYPSDLFRLAVEHDRMFTYLPSFRGEGHGPCSRLTPNSVNSRLCYIS